MASQTEEKLEADSSAHKHWADPAERGLRRWSNWWSSLVAPGDRGIVLQTVNSTCRLDPGARYEHVGQPRVLPEKPRVGTPLKGVELSHEPPLFSAGSPKFFCLRKVQVDSSGVAHRTGNVVRAHAARVKQGASGDVFLKFPQLGSGLASCAIYIFALRALVLEWTLSAMCTQDNTIDVSIFLPIGNHTSFGPALQDFKAADIWGSERDSPWDDERMSWISFMKR
ncbi:hypothetical protein B0H14DRAFT_2565084 [Mycena olivaceomarginata]|nr:hypothetical protein B0H14DRAFT_2565084 [Mycena olivaceomarginata]